MKLLLLIDSEPSSIAKPKDSKSEASRLKESLDAALTSAVFGLEVSLLFTGGATRYLEPSAAVINANTAANTTANTADQPSATDAKLSDTLQELALYGIENVFVAQDALTETGLDTEQLAIPVTPLNQQDIATLLSQQATVLHF